jgi:hypothetical protein
MSVNLDKFTLLIKNQPIDVASYSVRYDMFNGAGDFEADIDHTLMIDLTKGEVPFEIRINDQSMMIGFLEKVNRQHSKGNISQTVSGRDMCQVLIDNYIMQPQVYPGKPQKANSLSQLFGDSSAQTQIDIDTLINNVWQSSQTISSIATAGAKADSNGYIKGAVVLPEITLPSVDFCQDKRKPHANYADNAKTSDGKFAHLFQIKKIRTGHGQTLFDFFSHLLNGLGLYIYNIAGTRTIIIHSIQSDTPVKSYDKYCNLVKDKPYNIINSPDNPGNNVESASFSQDVSDYYTFFRFIGQTEDEDVFSEDKAPSYFIAERQIPGFKGVTKMRATSLHALNANVWYNEQVKLINNEFMNQNKKLYGFQYTLAGHSPDRQTPYYFNHVATLTDSYLHISNQPLLVYGVEYKGSKQAGQTTTLSLYSPSEVPKMISNPDIF